MSQRLNQLNENIDKLLAWDTSAPWALYMAGKTVRGDFEDKIALCGAMRQLSAFSVRSTEELNSLAVEILSRCDRIIDESLKSMRP